MKTSEVQPPGLKFAHWSVSFPDKGRRLFLAADQLEAAREAAVNAAEPGLWLFRAESGLCGIIPVRTKIIHRKGPVVGLAILHHNELIEICGRPATFEEVRWLLLEPGSHHVGRTCPYCHDVHGAGKTVVRCPLCGEAYCQDCWQALEGMRCCSRSCRFSPGEPKVVA